MTSKKMLSIAVISRDLNIPESTLHYWKNRFSEFLPSVGRARQKRFRPESVDIFRTIAEMLKEGHTTKDVKDALASMYPINIEPESTPVPVDTTPQKYNGNVPQTLEAQVQVAQVIGTEIAKVIGERLGDTINHICGGNLADIESRMIETSTIVESQNRELEAIREESNTFYDKVNAQKSVIESIQQDSTSIIEQFEAQREELNALRGENTSLKDNLSVMEAELQELRNRPVPVAGEGGDAGLTLEQMHEVNSVKDENNTLKEKLSILESELIRLRKDRREMEKFLLEKIRAK